MGLFNNLLIDESRNICIQFRYGYLDMSTYKIGDKIDTHNRLRKPKEIPRNARVIGVTTEELTQDDQYLFFEIIIEDCRAMSYRGVDPTYAEKLDKENGDSLYV